jgi:hypothetical protein
MASLVYREQRAMIIDDAQPHQQVGGTCYAYAVATIIVLSLKRIVGRKVPPYETILNPLIRRYGRDGAFTPEVLRDICPSYRLHCRRVDDMKTVLEGLRAGRPYVASFRLGPKEWANFERFFRHHRNGVLTKAVLDAPLSPGDREPHEDARGHRHAVVLLSANGRQLTFMNSWGKDWGDGGRFTIEDEKVLPLRFLDVYWNESELLPEERQAWRERKERYMADIRNARAKIRSPAGRFEVNFAPAPDDPLNGMIASLTEQCGGNVHDYGFVEVTSSPPLCDEDFCAPKNVADLKRPSYFVSQFRDTAEAIQHAPNNWVCYDFKQRAVVPTHYSIRSCANTELGRDSVNPKCWAVEGSMTGSEWNEIDHRENSGDLNRRNITCTYEVENSVLCRFVRFVNIGRNHAGNDCLCIAGFEIFGSMIDTTTKSARPPPPPHSPGLPPQAPSARPDFPP